MKYLRWVICLLFALPGVVMACAQVSGTSIDGRSVDYGRDAWAFEKGLKEEPAAKFRQLINQAERRSADERPAFHEAELAALRSMKDGDYAGAAAQFAAIEAEYPGDYAVAANLGTAYELAGENELALKWIREGMARNEESHYGTEWLHARILEYKIAMAEDPDYLRKFPIIPLPESFHHGTVIQIGEERIEAAELDYALNRQMEERLVFIKKDDPIVGDIIVAKADLTAQLSALEPAVELLEMSVPFGVTQPELVNARMAEYRETIRKADLRRDVLWGGGLGLAVVGFIAFFAFGCKRKWFFVSRVDRDKYLREKARIRF